MGSFSWLDGIGDAPACLNFRGLLNGLLGLTQHPRIRPDGSPAPFIPKPPADEPQSLSSGAAASLFSTLFQRVATSRR
jgi:hypothetical protein